jgi:hypothetical protein
MGISPWLRIQNKFFKQKMFLSMGGLTACWENFLFCIFNWIENMEGRKYPTQRFVAVGIGPS